MTTIDICDINAFTVNVGKEPKFFKYTTARKVDQFNDYDDYNGFFDIGGHLGAEIYKGHIYIKNFKIERGRTATPWVPSIEGCELDFIEPNLVNGTSDWWSTWGSGMPHYCMVPKSVTNITSCADLQTKDVVLGGESMYPLRYELQIQRPSGNHYPGHEVLRPNEVPEEMKIYHAWVKNTSTNLIDRISDRVAIVIRRDNWTSGQYRYRRPCIKPYVLNPIWCFSEMDVANPNLIKITKNAKWEADIELAEITEIEISDCPNPYVTSGYNVKYLNDTGVVGISMAGESGILSSGDIITVSCYVRVNELLDIEEKKQGIYIQTSTDPEADEASHFVFHHFTTTAKSKIGEWTRVSSVVNIISQITPMSVIYTRGLDIDVCGFKIERGDKLTAWVPYAASTLELQPEDMEPPIYKNTNEI